MNRQEFEERVFAEPDCTDADVINAAAQSSELQQIWKEAKQFNNELSTAIQLDIPKELKQNLLNIPEQATTSTVVALPKQKKPLAVWSLAASVAFAVGLSFLFITPSHDNLNGSELAMAHFQHENPYALKLSGDISLDDVNSKLATFNTQMQQKLGRVTYANYCFFGNHKSVHMVMDTVFGKITLFVTSKDMAFPIDANFGDENYQGQSWSLDNVDITIINERGKGTEADFAEIRRQIQYSA